MGKSTMTVAESQLVNLIPFDVSLALSDSSVGVDFVSMESLVTTWLNNYFETVTLTDGLYSFDQIILERVNNRRLRGLASTVVETYTGVSIWKNDKALPDKNAVVGYQLASLLAARDDLKTIFTAAPDSTGLGSSVVDVLANLNTDTTSNSSGNKLDVVIIVAISIAGLALLLLAFALYMAWRNNRARAAHYRAGNKAAGTAEASGSYHPATPVRNIPSPPPSEIGASPAYPESVISEDISTSLTAYYKSGVMGALKDKQQASYLNDAASVSSMESYGYSLDGYASSIGGPSLGITKK
jgi:hypothetical protein